MYPQACEEFKAISRKLYDKCNCIEELSDMREWMKGIPDKLREHQVRGLGTGIVTSFGIDYLDKLCITLDRWLRRSWHH